MTRQSIVNSTIVTKLIVFEELIVEALPVVTRLYVGYTQTLDCFALRSKVAHPRVRGEDVYCSTLGYGTEAEMEKLMLQVLARKVAYGR